MGPRSMGLPERMPFPVNHRTLLSSLIALLAFAFHSGRLLPSCWRAYHLSVPRQGPPLFDNETKLDSVRTVETLVLQSKIVTSVKNSTFSEAEWDNRTMVFSRMDVGFLQVTTRRFGVGGFGFRLVARQVEVVFSQNGTTLKLGQCRLGRWFQLVTRQVEIGFSQNGTTLSLGQRRLGRCWTPSTTTMDNRCASGFSWLEE
ncbi:hypothetical protein K0M31_015223 [Melipona bicolor]|uniref:Uncharacterized protein n=1 Tax=Melipona bicolor TaxID=60889 RepID=A0AA40KFH5_9HYME|nr:hypothetical protein K0M31_015223 [Melipona bicolor]